MKHRTKLMWAASSMALAVLLCLGTLRHGIACSADGWLYWQGSVSLLTGHGYTDFHDQAIGFWPPGYSIWLAMWQWVFGVSGRSLVLASTIATGIAAFAWTWLALSLGRLSRPTAIGVVVLTASLLAWNTRSLHAEHVTRMLAPLLLLILVRIEPGASSRSLLGWTVAAGLTLCAGLLARSSWVAAVAGFVVAVRVRGWRKRVLVAAIVALLSVVPWLLARSALGQFAGWHHGLDVARYGPLEYLWQLVAGIGAHLAPFPIGIAMWVAVVVVAWRHRPDLRTVVVFVLASAATLYVVFNLTYIHDELDKRFVVSTALALGVVGLVCSDVIPETWKRSAVVVLLVAFPAIKAAKHAIVGRQPRALEAWVAPEHAIDRAHMTGRASSGDGRIFVVPPPRR